MSAWLEEATGSTCTASAQRRGTTPHIRADKDHPADASARYI